MKNAQARLLRRILVAAVGAALLAMALWPGTLRVDSAVVARGTVRESFEAEGRTRLRERYVITAPLAALARRLTLEPGDAVQAGQPLVALDPVAAPTLDPRSLAQARAQLAAAESQLQAAGAEAAAADSAAALARSELARIRALAAQGMAPPQALQQAETAAQRSELSAQGARYRESTARHQLQAARAVLTAAGAGRGGGAVVLESPASGVVLKRSYQSAHAVQAGETLLEIGDPAALEVEVDVLSSDAVRLQPGQPVELTRWGGGPALAGSVRRVEPGAFTKVSALGVEEQRVWVMVTLASPREQWRQLGEGYRVLARFVLQQADAALFVPSSAVFREPGSDSWQVFRVAAGKARLQAVGIGLQGEGRTVVTSGLAEGDRVVLHPQRELSDGARVRTP
ncbi:MAG: hypothetical protein RJA36_3512 [Pseudomonadota bacterium]|jgi:HlyD family secretion protein